MYEATVVRVEDEKGARAVVTETDDILWVPKDLIPTTDSEADIPGGFERNGNLLTFGTESEGLGRLTYRLMFEEIAPPGFVVAVKQERSNHVLGTPA